MPVCTRRADLPRLAGATGLSAQVGHSEILHVPLLVSWRILTKNNLKLGP